MTTSERESWVGRRSPGNREAASHLGDGMAVALVVHTEDNAQAQLPIPHVQALQDFLHSSHTSDVFSRNLL